MNTIKLAGLIPPMLTPITANRDIDRDGIHYLVGHLLKNNVNGLFVMGTSGEGPWLTHEQIRVVVRETAAAVGGQIPVLAGVLQPGLGQALEVIDIVVSEGADAIVVTTPYYYNVDAATQQHYFETIVERSPVPVVLYNIPSKTHNPLNQSVVREIIAEPKVIGLKSSSEDFEDFKQAIHLKLDRPDFAVMQGDERKSLLAICAGADGLVTGLSNLVPGIFQNLLADESQAYQDEIEKLWRVHTHGHWLVCLKYAASVLQLCQPYTLSLHDELPTASRRAIEAILQPYTANK